MNVIESYVNIHYIWLFCVFQLRGEREHVIKVHSRESAIHMSKLIQVRLAKFNPVEFFDLKLVYVQSDTCIGESSAGLD